MWTPAFYINLHLWRLESFNAIFKITWLHLYYFITVKSRLFYYFKVFSPKSSKVVQVLGHIMVFNLFDSKLCIKPSLYKCKTICNQTGSRSRSISNIRWNADIPFFYIKVGTARKMEMRWSMGISDSLTHHITSSCFENATYLLLCIMDSPRY